MLVSHRRVNSRYDYLMVFNEWLQQELNRRGWNVADLAKRAEMYGYPISQPQLWRILSGDRQAGPDACISIAYGLGVSREEVFKARGWLLREPEQLTTTNDDPQLVKVVSRLRALPVPVFKRAIGGVNALVDTFVEAMVIESDEEVSRETLRELKANAPETYYRFLADRLGPNWREIVEGVAEIRAAFDKKDDEGQEPLGQRTTAR